MDIDKIRRLFPITEHKTYLKNAAESPLHATGEAALKQYLSYASTDPDKKPQVREPIRNLLAELFGGDPKDYALTTSTGVGMSTAAAGYRWQAGDNVVFPSGEHWNSTFPWFRLEGLGVEARTVKPDSENRVLPEMIADKVDENTRVISATAVRFDTGFRIDLKKLSGIAKQIDALLVIDGIQMAGASPINVIDDGIDVFACGGFKWLLGMPGTGFVYMNERARERIDPVMPGMFAGQHSFTELEYHEDSRRYETGSTAYSLFHAWHEGLNILKDVGMPNIHNRNRILTDRLASGLKEKDLNILTPLQNPSERSAIVTFTLGDKGKNKIFCSDLANQGILVSNRGDSIRVSPNFFNTEEEIDQFLNCL